MPWSDLAVAVAAGHFLFGTSLFLHAVGTECGDKFADDVLCRNKPTFNFVDAEQLRLKEARPSAVRAGVASRLGHWTFGPEMGLTFAGLADLEPTPQMRW